MAQQRERARSLRSVARSSTHHTAPNVYDPKHKIILRILQYNGMMSHMKEEDTHIIIIPQWSSTALIPCIHNFAVRITCMVWYTRCWCCCCCSLPFYNMYDVCLRLYAFSFYNIFLRLLVLSVILFLLFFYYDERRSSIKVKFCQRRRCRVWRPPKLHRRTAIDTLRTGEHLWLRVGQMLDRMLQCTGSMDVVYSLYVDGDDISIQELRKLCVGVTEKGKENVYIRE